jgi:hypothetical protein
MHWNSSVRRPAHRLASASRHDLDPAADRIDDPCDELLTEDVAELPQKQWHTIMIDVPPNLRHPMSTRIDCLTINGTGHLTNICGQLIRT